MRFNLTSNSGQAIWLAIANFISFSFGIISAAILSRLLTVEEYGSYKQILYIYSTLLTIFTLGLPKAYSFFLARLPIEEGRSAINHLNSLFITLGTIFSITLFFGSTVLASVLKNPELSILLKWFSPTPLFLLPVMGLESIMATYRKSSYATVYVVLSRLFMLVCVVVPVILKGGVESAVIGFTVSSVLCFIIGIIVERKPFRGVKSNKTNLKTKDILSYSLPLLLINLTGMFEKAAPQFYISRNWGVSEFAEFSNGYIELPFATMVIGAVSTVLLPLFSKLSNNIINKKEILRLWDSSFVKSIDVIYPLTIFCFFFADYIIYFLYGEKYIGSVIYFKIILALTLIRIVPYGPILMALNKNRQYLLVQVITTLGAWFFCGVYVLMGGGKPQLIAVISTLVAILYLLMLLLLVAHTLKVRVRELIPESSIIKVLALSSIACLIPYFIIGSINVNCFLSLAIGFVIYAICFVIFSRVFNMPNLIVSMIFTHFKKEVHE